MSWLHLYAAVQLLVHAGFRTVDLGCQRAPGLPCALFISEGEKSKQSSGEMRREDAQLCLRLNCELEGGAATHTLRHCERSKAIQAVSTEGFWIASLRSMTLLMQLRAARCGIASRPGHVSIAFAQLS
ncbi:hypothetical protein ABIG06_007384 [Bradyrhizobium sp. USDA 326]|uniref:hypothetical protein n=1 Tax=unclassified Bradyrhizobium TaxID=2631580 RepID=UPI000F5377C0|nr:hypothetical protein [Bradyrhizobium sp. RP6]RQH15638.1 hypothetical protein EHH60_00070 [Bradyrhizobium sp. RP6]